MWKKTINITWKFPSQWNKNVKPLLIKKHLLLCFLQDQWKLMKGPLRYLTELTSLFHGFASNVHEIKRIDTLEMSLSNNQGSSNLHCLF